MEFEYQAVNQRSEIITGKLDAADEREALRILRQQNLAPLVLGMPGEGRHVRSDRNARITEQEKVLLLQELATLLEAGVPLAESIESLGASRAGTQAAGIFNEFLSALRKGEAFSSSLRKSTLSLPAYCHQLVAAGEQTGQLARSIRTAVTQLNYEMRVREEMRNALLYPALLVVSGILAVVVVFLVVVPKFANLLQGNQAELIPPLSRWVIGFGLLVKDNLTALVILALAMAMGVVLVVQNPRARERAFEKLASVPLLGQWILQAEIGRWASMLGAMLESRVPIVTAMDLSISGLRLPVLRSKLMQVQRDVRSGVRLADALEASRAVGATGVNLVRVGERSGALAPMLQALARLHEEAGRDRMRRFLLLLEPVAILLVGGVIGIIMVAIMMAVTSLSDTVV